MPEPKSILDKMRTNQTNQAGQAGQSNVKPPDKRPSKPIQKNRPVAVSEEDVVCTCGHKVKFPVYADKQDKYRDQRRKKVTDRPCSACRIEAERVKSEEARKNRKPKKPRFITPEERDRRANRLPHGSEFTVRYDSSKQTWSGTLSVPVVVDPPESTTMAETATHFTGEVSGVFTLLRDLDRQYREWLAAQTPSQTVV